MAIMNEMPTHLSALARLTEKQREVLALVADNRTSKEIAQILGVSISAVNQRIEVIRARLGSVPRTHLARLYRQQLADEWVDATCNSLTGETLQLTEAATSRQAMRAGSVSRNASGQAWEEIQEPGQKPGGGSQLPALHPVFDGPNGSLARIAMIIMIALGLLLVVLASLAIAEAITQLATRR